MKNLRTKVLSAVLAVSVLGASAVAFKGCGKKDSSSIDRKWIGYFKKL